MTFARFLLPPPVTEAHRAQSVALYFFSPAVRLLFVGVGIPFRLVKTPCCAPLPVVASSPARARLWRAVRPRVQHTAVLDRVPLR